MYDILIIKIPLISWKSVSLISHPLLCFVFDPKLYLLNVHLFIIWNIRSFVCNILRLSLV